jgi:hypothetical protein
VKERGKKRELKDREKKRAFEASSPVPKTEF